SRAAWRPALRVAVPPCLPAPARRDGRVAAWPGLGPPAAFPQPTRRPRRGPLDRRAVRLTRRLAGVARSTRTLVAAGRVRPLVRRLAATRNHTPKGPGLSRGRPGGSSQPARREAPTPGAHTPRSAAAATPR